MTYSYKQLCSLLVCLTLACSTFGETIYVKTNATGDTDGESWEDAFNTLFDALQEAEAGDEIWVAAGTYYPTSGTNRSISFVIPSGVSILGGFPNSGNPTLANRNPQNNLTILSGDIDQSGSLVGNSYTIIYTKDVNANTLVDGFTISGGNADGGVAMDFPVLLENGGAAWFNEASNGSNSTPTIKNCIFSENVANNRGGAMFHKAAMNGNANYVLEDCIFQNNTANQEGGAIFNAQSGTGSACNPIVSNCNFINNTAAKSGGAIYNNGSYFGEVSGVYTNCSFVNNKAIANEGGAIYNNAFFFGLTSPSYEACEFKNNDASPGSGGAIYFDASGDGIANYKVIDCLFDNNLSSVYGGAICNIISNKGQMTPIIVNSIFKENSSVNGGATYSRGAFISKIDLTIVNCVFYKNVGNIGGAIYQNEAGPMDIVQTKVSNSIFEQNTAGFSPTFHLTGLSSIDVNNCLFDVNNCLELVQGGGNNEADCNGGNLFNQDPLFVNPAACDFHIPSNSPAVDAGNNGDVPAFASNDADGNPRVAGGIVDLGVYEQVNNNSDNDADGILDIDDNCPLIPNTDQADVDGDGAGTVCDCDDSVATGTSCSSGCSTFYADADNDGFGDPSNSVITCVAPSGFVDNNLDFNDGDNTLYPNAPELCDMKDNNNNGQIDEGTDDDGDGVCNEDDQCEGGDDLKDDNNNGIPDDCESQITLSCPADITVNAAPGELSAVASWTEPTASTDCEEGGSTGGSCGDPIPGFVYKGEHNGHDYYLSSTPTIWTAAQANAAANGANLVMINNQAENDFVKSIIGFDIVHIGVTDAATEGEFKFVNGDDIDFSNFNGTPGGNDYGIMYFWDGSWNMDGDYTKNYVIEKPCSGGNDGGLTLMQTAGPANGANFSVGTTQVTYTAEDECDGLKTCSFNVTVVPTNSSLSINCPADINITAAPGATTAVATWNEPIPTSNCTTGTPTATPSITSGSAFPLGTTMVTYTATDDCGGSVTCTFQITVTEGTNVVNINCPADINITAAPGATTAIVTWSDPTLTSNCTNGTPTATPSIASGSAFPLGPTQVTYTATDNCGGSATCTFMVTVTAGNSTVNLNCPSDIIMDADAGATSKVISYSTPIGSTTCATGGVTVELLEGLASGSPFLIGTTLVKYKGTDQCGTVAECSFNVTINATNSTIQINCPSDITASVNSASGTVAVTWDDPTGASTCATGGYSFTQTAGPAKGSQFGVGSTTITYLATDNCGESISCSFVVTVNVSSSNISIMCPSDINLSVPQGSGGGIASWSTPTATTDCTTGGGSGTPSCSGANIAGFTYKGEFNGSDYYISDGRAPWLTAKANAEAAGGTLASIENQAENDFILSIVDGEIVSIGLTDMDQEGNPVWLNGESTNFQNFSGFNANSQDNDYTVFYHWDGSWDWANNASWRFYLMEVKCGGPVNSIPVITQEAGLPSGSNFPVGTTTISYKAEDDCGNLTTCSFNINVTETVQTCDADSDGGQISGNELICDPYDPQTITSTTLPSGGSGTIEYTWLKSESGVPNNINQAIPNSNSPSYNPPFITTTTQYVRWSRRANCTNWVASNPITKTVDDCGTSTNYCDLSAEQPWQEWISKVELADLSNTSGKSLGYDDYTNLVANVTTGQEYTISVNLTFSYNQWDENVYVWIDFNQDNDFNDPGELVLEQISPSNGNGGAQPDAITQAFTVPTNATPGNTRMRVAMKREAGANPCDAANDGYVHGEVEDYSVNISAAAGNRARPVLAFEAYPVRGETVLEWYSNTTDLENNFEIERSFDNQTFEKIDNVAVIFDEDFDSYYKIVDNKPLMGDNYYRIKQNFNNGETVYTNIEKLVYGTKETRLHFYPNPATEVLFVDLKGYTGQKGDIQIINMLGQVMVQIKIETFSDPVLQIPLDKLDNGMHTLLFTTKGQPVQTELFIVEKMR